MDIKYTQCQNCFIVYSEDLQKCPRCGEPKSIQEDLNNTEPVFNICDGE